MPRHIALIPARKGSKSIVNKNLQRLGNKSLIQWALDSAVDARFFTKIIISTDIPEVLDTEMTNPIFVQKRPEHLCTDEAVMADVCCHVIKENRIAPDDFLWILQPTSPFREHQDFVSIKALINKYEPESVMSVKEANGDHPNRMYTAKGVALYPLRKTNFENRQNLMRVLIRNGCFYVTKASHISKYKDFGTRPSVQHLMTEERSVNIDSEVNFITARGVLEMLRKRGRF